MPLSWNEIKTRAHQFAADWVGTHREEADAKPFLDAFFDVFGIARRRVATFEHRVKKLGDADGYIDLFWKGMFLVEMKSRGKDLDKAFKQAKDYCQTLKNHELPRAILVCDFQKFRLHSLEDGSIIEFELTALRENVHHFGWLIGFQKTNFRDEDPVNIEAAERMGRLHDALADIGYDGPALETYLVRLLFCLFSEDTGIFERKMFQEFLEHRTAEDGADLAARLAELFQILNTPADRRLKNLDESLAAFPYVNGRLFAENLPFASFDSKMRTLLLECCWLDWSKISPAIFGSMFQSVMDKTKRRNLGAHYTSEKNILKVIRPLFLDELAAEFEKKRKNPRELTRFHEKLAELRFLDPACGCGNFLIITFRELRKLEIEVLRELRKNTDQFALGVLTKIMPDQFFGIELDEFAVRVAETAMWLTQHQMNRAVEDVFGEQVPTLPLKASAKILHANALRVDWAEACPAEELGFILGNPPFVGSKLQTEAQRADMVRTFGDVADAATMDFVSAWYIKAARFIQKTPIRCAFVSTNSICQGEQVGVLWGEMLNTYGIKIHFAHRTFKWSNEAKGNAAVFCIVVGFGNADHSPKTIFDYEDVKGEPKEILAENINPYLVDARNVLIKKRSNPLDSRPKLLFGNQPNDGGFLLFDDDEKAQFIKDEPGAEQWIRPLISAHEFLNGHKRWCLWLKGIQPNELRGLKKVFERVESVKNIRLASNRKATVELANVPSLFGFISQPDDDFILVPLHSSENRNYIPLGFFDKNKIVHNSCSFIPKGNRYIFGILSSAIHMAWVKNVCGRIKSDFRYSGSIVYNNYPFPTPTEKQKAAVETAAQGVLDARAQFPTSSLADLYDPLAMPPVLVRAHQTLDRAVDLCYRSASFGSEMERVAYLFGEYERLVNPLGLAVEGVKKKNKK